MKKIIFTIITISFLTITSFAQSNIYNCGTDLYLEQQLKNNIEAASSLIQYEEGFKTYLANYNTTNKKATKYIIPVVVHVFHDNGSENISDAVIINTINKMNQYYSGTTNNIGLVRNIFKPLIANCEIEFRLAKKDPNGNCTNGIVRVHTTQTYRGNDFIKKLSTWDTKSYLNIWLTQAVYSGQGNAVGGFSTLPFGGFSASKDGTICVASQFISDNTGAHEAGHWLGLYHPFQNSGDSCSLDNDGVEDTPPTYFKTSTSGVNTGRGNFCGNQNYNTCTSENPDMPDMQENIMDYFGGSCSGLMFTNGQKARMHYCLENYRQQLWSADNLVKTGTNDITPINCAPIAAFNTKTQNICEGGNLVFIDYSYNGTATQWNWEFPGGNPATFSGKSPGLVSYANAGKYDVKLTVTNAVGASTTTLQNYITVNPTNGLKNPGWQTKADWYYLNNYQQEGWRFESEFSTNQFVKFGASYGNIASMRLPQDPFNSKNSINNNFSLISPSFNFSNASNPYFALNYAFARGTLFTTPTEETLIIYSSTDCGKTWVQRALKNANNISTIGNVQLTNTTNFIPADNTKWSELIYSGASFPKMANVMFKITFKYAGGNNFYLDNVRAGDGAPTSVNQIANNNFNLKVLPNPIANNATLQYFLAEPKLVKISITDLLGKQVGLLVNENQNSGEQNINFNKADFNLTNGIYLINLTTENENLTYKIMVQ